MLRIILSVIAATLVGFFVITFLETVSHEIVPLPQGVSVTDPDSYSGNTGQFSLVLLLLLLVSYIAGAFVGGGVAAVLVREKQLLTALVTGLLMMAIGIVFFVIYAYPLWFEILASVSFIPIAMLGASFGKRMKSNDIF